MAVVTESVYDRITASNYGVLTHEEQARLRASKVGVIGAGGVGGQLAIQCARLGIGTIRVIDNDHFEYSNLNRQMLSTTENIGKPKALIAQEHLTAINPDLDVEGIVARVTEDNAADLLAGADVVVDCTDNLVSRVIVHRGARALQIPSVWIAVTPPFRGAVTTILPDGTDYESALGVPSAGLQLTEDMRVTVSAQKDGRARHSVERGALAEWGEGYLAGRLSWAVTSPIAGIVGILASFEAMKVLIARPGLEPVTAPRLTVVDLASPNMVRACEPPPGGWRYEEL